MTTWLNRMGPGLLVTAIGVVVSLWLHATLDAVGTLTWAVILGAVAANVNLLPDAAGSGIRFATRKLLRGGVVLLGFSLPLATVVALGLPVIALIVVTLLSTLVLTYWIGVRMGLGRPTSLLIATGFSICGASAIAAMQETAAADEDDVATAIAMVTICGSFAMIALPLLQAPLGLSDTAFGIWSGASVHEVGQVVAAASPAGAAAVAVAVTVKLTRVVMLAPVVAGVSILRRRSMRQESRVTPVGETLPPLVPLFVLGFIACMLIRSTGVLGGGLLGVIGQIQTVALAAALFGLGTGVHLPTLVRGGGRALGLAVVSTLVVAAVSLGGVVILA